MLHERREPKYAEEVRLPSSFLSVREGLTNKAKRRKSLSHSNDTITDKLANQLTNLHTN